ncbi:MAG: hypothetical protein SFU27_06880 [Thermonemataceae bacterium]|nr:hypothetical protein [Thermonemataceae bacterium]
MKKILDKLIFLWNSQTPKLFVWLQKILLAMSFTSAYAYTQIEKLPKWSWLDEALQIGVIAGVVGTFLAQFTTTQGLKDDTENKIQANNEANPINNTNHL